MKRILFCVAAFWALSLPVRAQLGVKTYVLDNGLTVWINEDHTRPTAFGAVVVKAGARDCPETGIAHYFEHMMFKGTGRIGTTDYASEKPLLDSIVRLYDRLPQAGSDSARLAIQMEINKMNIAASRYAIPNEFDALTTVCGGSDLNAFTSQDMTVYHSDFIPACFDTWAEINAERIIDPVFRLFQSELETVYEEKNRASDNAMDMFIEKGMERFYASSPYAAPVLGTTENLKNPRISQMAAFFRKYYVASNMGLILCGDLDAEEVLPVIRRTFGRIPRGVRTPHTPIVLKDFRGREFFEIEADIPLVRLGVLCWRAPSEKDPDSIPLSVLAYMLNNAESCGLLDAMMAENRILAGAAVYPGLCFEDAGVFGIVVAPKLIGQSRAQAEKRVLGAVEDLREGRFDETLLQQTVAALRKGKEVELEDLDGRAMTMIYALSAGRSWEEEMARIEALGRVTKADVVRVAKKYLGDDYLVLQKKYGSAKPERLPKPPYAQVVPQGKDAVSAYADSIRKAVQGRRFDIPRLDFDRDVRRMALTPRVQLFAAENPVNDIFNLSLCFGRGTLQDPALERVAAYVNTLGAAGKSYEQLHRELQRIGADVTLQAGENDFRVEVSGFDARFAETLQMVALLLDSPDADRKKLSKLKDEENAGRKMERGDLSSLGRALFRYALYGKRSPSLEEKGELSEKYLLARFREVQQVECDILYTGRLPLAQVGETLRGKLRLDAVQRVSDAPLERPFQALGGPKVLLIDKKDARQSMIYALVEGDPQEEAELRDRATFYNMYLGVNMTSLLFQEIREFRSMAYSTGSALIRPVWKNRAKQGCVLMAVAGTQCDKTFDVMAVIDSLLRDTPVLPGKFADKKTEFRNELYHSYPDFRARPERVSRSLRNGVASDLGAQRWAHVERLDAAGFKAFSKSRFEGRPVTWCIVGRAADLDRSKLSAYGPVTLLKPEDVIR